MDDDGIIDGADKSFDVYGHDVKERIVEWRAGTNTEYVTDLPLKLDIY